MGRPPLGDKPMSAAERQRRRRQALRDSDPVTKPGKGPTAKPVTEPAAEAVTEPVTEREVDPATFPRTTRERFERAVRAAERRLRVQIEAEAWEKVRKAYDEIYLPHLKDRVEKADRILAAYKGLMSREAYRTIVACLHPDNSASVERRTEAFRTFTALEDRLVKPDPPPLRGPPVPKTTAELLARRKKPRPW